MVVVDLGIYEKNFNAEKLREKYLAERDAINQILGRAGIPKLKTLDE